MTIQRDDEERETHRDKHYFDEEDGDLEYCSACKIDGVPTGWIVGDDGDVKPCVECGGVVGRSMIEHTGGTGHKLKEGRP